MGLLSGPAFYFSAEGPAMQRARTTPPHSRDFNAHARNYFDVQCACACVQWCMCVCVGVCVGGEGEGGVHINLYIPKSHLIKL